MTIASAGRAGERFRGFGATPKPYSMRRGTGVAATVLLAVTLRAAEAQSPLRPAVDPPPPPGSQPWRVLAGPEYDAGWFRRLMLGGGYRDLWTTPVVVPVLNLKTEAGGLRPIRVGGGFQTQTIHFRGADDGYYLFRSVNKAVRNGLEPDLRDTPAGWLVQEATSLFHPAGAWVVPPLLEAVGVPQSTPKLFIMPDDPILGEHREAFAGVLGQLIESPDKGESGKKRFRGSDDIASSPDMLEKLASSPMERVDARSLLASRLIDIVIGDPDRNFDNFRWIAFDSAQRRVWHPVPMDRDPAFLRTGGVIPWIVRELLLPKAVKFGPGYEDVSGLWASQHEVDRLLLAEIDRPTFDSVVAAVQAGLTDRVIQDAVASLPAEYQQVGGGFLATSLRSRRDELREVAGRFYEQLADEVDVQGTSAPEIAEVVRRADGWVEVALHAQCQLPRLVTQSQDSDPVVCSTTHFRRRFDPAVTDEVRIYLRGGDDQARVTGEGPQEILVRVIGGEGNDRFQDTFTPDGSSRTVFYDHEGDNQLTGSGGARLERGRWDGRVITDFVHEDKDGTIRDYGHDRGWTIVGGHDREAGFIGGLGHRVTDYGFRRDPWGSRFEVSVLGSTGGGYGGALRFRRRIGGSDVVISPYGSYENGLSSYRFYGYGNDTPNIDSDLASIPTDEATGGIELELPLGRSGTLFFGPAVRWVSSEPRVGSPLLARGLLGAGDFGQAGVIGGFELRNVNNEEFPRLGFELRGEATAYSPLQGETDPFGGARGEVRGYAPFLLGSSIAARVGGGTAWGSFPVHESIFLGGRRSLRGYRSERLAGDAALYGNAELRLPIGHLTLLTRGRVGLIGFADAGRVWVDGESSGDWHTSWGGGLWYSTMGLTGTLVYGVGEQNRFHAYFGLPF